MLMFAGLVGLMMAASIADVASLWDKGDDPDTDPQDGSDVDTGSGNVIDGTPLGAAFPGTDATDDANGSGAEAPIGTTTGQTGAPGIPAETTPQNDILVGTPADDHIDGAAGDDQIGGYAGDDLLQGGAGEDDLRGDSGQDRLSGGDGNDTLAGGADDDSLMGDAGHDELVGQEGDDTLSGDAGNDSLLGGAGDDSLTGGAGNDGLQGGDGNDILAGGDGQDTLMGGNGDDRLTDRDAAGDPSRDFLNGGAGHDTLLAGEGDWLDGGAGHDDFVLNEWLAAGGDAATIGDYNPDEDQIVVVYDPASYPEPELSVAPTEGSPNDMEVFLNGTLVAHVLDSPDLTVADLTLLPTAMAQAA